MLESFGCHQFAGFSTAVATAAIHQVGFVWIEFFNFTLEVLTIKINFNSTFNHSLCCFLRSANIEDHNAGLFHFFLEGSHIEVDVGELRCVGSRFGSNAALLRGRFIDHVSLVLIVC